MPKSIAVAVAVLLALAVLHGRADATPILQLSISQTGYSTQYVTTTPGNTISFIGNYGSYNNGTKNSGLQVIAYGDETGISFTVQIAKTTAAYPTLTIAMTETDLPAGDGTVITFDSYTSATLHTASTLTTNTYYDLTDTAYGTQHLISTRTQTGPLSTGGTETTLSVPIGVPYSITKVAILSPAANAFPTYGPQLYVTVPEPASWTLFGAAIVPILLRRPRRRD